MGARSHGGLGGAAAGGERDGDWALGLGEEDSKEDKVALEVGSHTGIGLWWAKFASETDFGTGHFGFLGISGTGI